MNQRKTCCQCKHVWVGPPGALDPNFGGCPKCASRYWTVEEIK